MYRKIILHTYIYIYKYNKQCKYNKASLQLLKNCIRACKILLRKIKNTLSKFLPKYKKTTDLKFTPNDVINSYFQEMAWIFFHFNFR